MEEADMSRRRLSKKQLKQDKFVSTTFELAQFAQEHSRNVIVGLVAAFLLLVGGIYYWQYRSQSEANAATVLMNGRLAYDAGNFQLAITDLELFKGELSGTKYGDEGMIVLADSYYQIGDYANAREVLERFSERYSDRSPLSSKAYNLLGCSLENLGASEDAATAFLRGAESARFDYQRVKLRMDAARAFHQAGNSDRAAEEYRFILENFPDVPESNQATLLLSEIEAAIALEKAE